MNLKGKTNCAFSPRETLTKRDFIKTLFIFYLDFISICYAYKMIPFIKRFAEWFAIKPQLDMSNHKPPFFNEREVWWCSIGENVGSEISGKGKHFRRPLLILRKLDTFSFIGIPLTTQPKTGTWYSFLRIKEKDNNAVLSQIQYVDYKRMDKLLYTVDYVTFQRIKKETISLIWGDKIDHPLLG